jgi:carbon-monoxide dehydrogenase medium subunit
MKPAAFDYVRARSLEEALAALAQRQGEARALAGGQTLGPMLNLRLATPSCLIDIGQIAALKTVEKRGASRVIGACVTHAAIEDRSDASPTGTLLSHVASNVAYRAIRNRGTIGGSLAHADPAADWVTTMTLLDAQVTIAGRSGARSVPMREFMRGAFTTAIQPMELLHKIEIPELSSEARWGYYRICRKVGEFPDAIGAIVLDPERGFGRVVTSSPEGAPVLLPELAAEVAARGTTAATREAISSAVKRALPDLDAVDLQLHAVAVRRAIVQAFSHA